jgi:hypothetical protein
MTHPLLGKVVRWTHGQNVLVGPATHYDEDDDELFFVPEGLIHGHYWVPASECEQNWHCEACRELVKSHCPHCGRRPGRHGKFCPRWEEKGND